MSEAVKFNFDEIINRRNNNSMKWTTYSENVLPMWVADMDFRSPPDVIQGLQNLAASGIYGYAKNRPERLLDAIIYRIDKLYNWKIKAEDIILLPGVVPGLNIAGRMFRQQVRDASVMTTTPVYPPFLSVAENQNLTPINVPLKEIVTGNRLDYEMDFEAMEAAMQEDTAMFMLCQPHNPSGRVYSKSELSQLAKLATKHDLTVVSDEIHGELLLGGAVNYPYALTNSKTREHTITLFSASKTFNIAGFGGGFAIIENAELRQHYEAALIGMVPGLTIASMKAMEFAFDYGDEWLEALKEYLTANRDYLIERLSLIPNLKFTYPDATHLIWLDFRETKLGEDAHKALLDAGLALNDGVTFGGPKGTVRLNFATPREILSEGIDIIHSCFDL